MRRLTANKVRGMSWISKISLVLFFTMVFSIFMFEGLYNPKPVMAAPPTFQAAGTAVAGPGAITVAWPAHQVDDIALLLVETANQTVTLSTPSGFVAVTNSPQGTGTAGGDPATRLTVFWARATSAAMANVVIADSGDHNIGRIITFRGVVTTGNPWDITAGAVAASTSTAVSIPTVTTTVADTLVVTIVSNMTETNTAQTSGWTNANLTGLTEIADSNTSSGNGGGFGAAAGVKAAAGATGATTATLANASVQGLMTIALLPADTIPPSVTIDQAVGQADPTGTSYINFTVVFSESVSNFATGDVTITGTAGGTKTATVTGSGTTYNVAVTGMTTAGTVIATIAAGVATDAAGNGNTASTSTDNTVTWIVLPYTTSCTNGGKDGPATISGIVNTYYPGNSVAPGYPGGVLPAGSTSIPVGALDARGSAAAIATGDLLLVIQMQDADFNSSNNATYGDGQNAGSGYTALNQSGLYEYVIATGPVAAGLVPIQGSGAGNGLANSFRTRAYLAGTNGQSTFQVIRVPQYSAATVAAATTVTAPAWAWDGVTYFGTGGVVVMDVAGTLTIDGTIDVNGLGFRGGMGRQLVGGAGANTDYVTLATNAANGSKGEGIAGTPRYMNRPVTFNGPPVQVNTVIEGYPNGSYGRGAPGNAGGGGTDGNPAANDENSGGGGGANYGWGGKGGNSWNSNINVGGEGGSYVTGLAYNRVVLGGGGGAGSNNNNFGENLTFTNPPGLACNTGGGACSSGAPGGGIIILRTKIFTGSGSVTAEGGDAYNVANDSAGGGGAGGSIVLDSQLGGTVTASVRGGDGGNAWRTRVQDFTCGGAIGDCRHGPGGGGGGGFLAYSPQSGLVVLATIDGGINGKTTSIADYYGTTSSDGGITIFENPTVSGPKSAAACLPVMTVSKSTSTPTISGLPGTATYTIKVANDIDKSTAEGVVISDNLPGVPALFTNASNPPTTIAYNPNSAPCDASRVSTSNALVGTSTPVWSSWNIPAGCEVSLTFDVTVPAGTIPTTYQNPATATYLDPERTTSTGTKSITYNPSSSTNEDVTVLAPPSISKAFGASIIDRGVATTITLTLSNSNSVAITGVGFTDTLPTAMEGPTSYMVILNPPAPSTTCGGTAVYTALSGYNSFSVSGLSIPANSTCTVTFSVTAYSSGIYVNTIPAGALTSSTGTNTNPATATLTVGNSLQPPSIAKSFGTNPVLVGATTTLTFTLTNPNATSIGSAGFIDMLPTEVVIAAIPNVVITNCGAGTVTAAAGTNYISLNTNATIAAGTPCTVSVDVVGRSAGLYQNASGQVVGDTGAGNRASAELRVMAPIVVAKSFDTNPVATSIATVLRIKLTNPNAIAVTGVGFTDTYPSGMINSTPNSALTGCGGSLTVSDGGSSLAITGASIPANSSCFVTVNVQASASGSYTNSTGPVTTTNAGTAPSASSTLSVLSPPQVRKVFSPDLISSNGQSGMQIIISNPTSNPSTLTGVAVCDTYTGSLTNVGSGTVLCTQGSSATLTTACGAGTSIGITGGSILPGGSCMITQLVTASTNNTNTTSAPTSTNGGTGVAATAVLKVMQPILVAKSFSNSHPAVGANVTMTISLTNPNPDIVKNIVFLDNYAVTAPNLVNAAAPNPAFTPANCLGTGARLVAAAAGTSLQLFNGMMYPNTTCNITVVVNMNLNNVSQINNTGNITTANAGTSPGDSATISTGGGIAPVELTKTFTPTTINVGLTSTLQFTVTNTAFGANPANAITFTDVLPAGLTAPNGVTPNVCGAGSTLTIAGGNTITLAAGTLAAGANCIFNVTVTGVAAGPYVNRTGQITQAGGIVGNYAEAAIEVTIAPAVSKSFGSAYMAPGATNQLTIRIDNPNSTAITTTADFIDLFPTSPGAMTLANGFVTNNTCSLPIWDSNVASDTSLIYAPTASPIGVLTNFGAGVVASATGAINQVLTGAFAVPAGTSRVLLVVVELEASAAADTFTVNTATYGGQNLTQLYMTPAGTFNRIYVGYLKEKEIAAALSTTLTVTLSNPAAPSWALMKAGVFSNVNQIKPFTSSPEPGGNQYVANFNDTAALTFNFGATPLTVKNNGRAMYFSIFNNGATTATIPAGFTAEMFDHTSNAGNAFRVEGGYKTIVADGTESGTNITLSAAQRYGVVGLALQPNVYTGTLPGGIRIPSGTSIPAGGCEFTVNVTASTAGVYTNTINAGDLQTSAGNNTTAASTSLVIPKLGPLVSEVFVPATINSGGTSRLIMTFENPNAIPISLTALFTNTLPAGVVLAGTPNIVTTCSGGTGGSTAANNVTLTSGAIIPAGTFEVPGSCTLSVDVTAAASGIYPDTIPAGDLQTTAGSNTDEASAVLTVTAYSPPTVSKAFGTTNIGNTGDVTTLTITLSNPNSVTATLTANMTDTFPVQITLANATVSNNTCGFGIVDTTGGALNAGDLGIRINSGSVIPAGGCTFTVYVTSATAGGPYTNTIGAGALQTNRGNNPGPTSDSLTVVSDDLKVTKTITSFSDPCIAGSCQIVYRITLQNVGTVNKAGVTVTDTLAAALTYVSSSASQGAYVSGTGIWTVGAVNSGVTHTLDITATVNNTGTAILNCASLSSADGNAANNTSCRSIIPTRVVLSDFRAFRENGQTVVEWTTDTEINTVGFYLFRLDSATGEYLRINNSILPAVITSQHGGRYRLIDKGAPSVRTLTYVLIEVEGRGARNAYGPFTMTQGTGDIFTTIPESGTRTADLISRTFLPHDNEPHRTTSSGITKSLDGNGVLVVTSSSSRHAANSSGNLYSDYRRAPHEISRASKERRNALKKQRESIHALAATRSGTMIKIPIRSEGLYYISAEEIAGLLGISIADAADKIRTNRFRVANRGTTLTSTPDEANSGIYFYAQGIDSLYTKDNIYWLTENSGLAMQAAAGEISPPAAPGAFPEVIHAEDETFMAPSLFTDSATDYWFWNYIVAGDSSFGSRTYTVRTDGVSTSAHEAVLTVKLHGFSDASVGQDHHVVASLNGTTLGEARWNGMEPKTLEFRFEQGILNSGNNTIVLYGILDAGVPYSIVLVKSFDIAYQRRYEAVNNSLTFTADAPGAVTVEGFTNPDIHVFDITDPLHVSFYDMLNIQDAGGSYTMTISPVSAGARYLAITTDAASDISGAEPVTPSRLTARSNRADYIIITPEELVSAAGPLAQYRQTQGLRSMVISLEDIMNEFNYGISSPLAIRDFIAHAARNWSKPPQYVLLAGNGTFDYKNNRGFSDNLLPTLLTVTPAGLFPADNLLADINADHIPDIAIGRLPVLTEEEMRDVTSKIIAHEYKKKASFRPKVVLVADNPDDGGDFPADSNSMAAVIPRGYSVQKIYLSDYPLDTARQLLMQSFINGIDYLNYIGHAGINRLANEGLLLSSDVDTLSNTSAFPVMTAMTCSAGQFATPGYDSLAEALVLKKDGGAAAVWAPSGMSFNIHAKILDTGFFHYIFNNSKAVLGKAIKESLKYYKAMGGPEYMMDIYNLLGDPAMRMW